MGQIFSFTFYPGEYLRDTQCLSEVVQVAYDRIMCEHIRDNIISPRQHKFFTKKLSPEEIEELNSALVTVEGGYQIPWVAESIRKSLAYSESRRNSRLKGDEDNVRIYIVRDNVRSTYKIGSSTNPIRRYNELNNQKSPAIMADGQGSRDISLIWYSDPIERRVETELHKHFKNKCLYGEWFGLSETDLTYIYTKYPGTTYDKRTVDVNVDVDVKSKSKLKIEDELNADSSKENSRPAKKMSDVIWPFDSPAFKDAWQLWTEYRKEKNKPAYKPIGLQGVLSELAKLSGGYDTTAIKIIYQSIHKNWEGFFSLKNDNQNGKQFSKQKVEDAINAIYDKN